MFFAKTFPSSTPIWSDKLRQQRLPYRYSWWLTERVDTPDYTLREDLVFIQRNKGSERRGCKKGEDDTVAGPVAFEHLALHKRLRSISTYFL